MRIECANKNCRQIVDVGPEDGFMSKKNYCSMTCIAEDLEQGSDSESSSRSRSGED